MDPATWGLRQEAWIEVLLVSFIFVLIKETLGEGRMER